MPNSYEIGLVFGNEKNFLPTVDEFRETILDTNLKNSKARKYIDLIEKIPLVKQFDSLYAKAYWNFIVKRMVLVHENSIFRNWETLEMVVAFALGASVFVYLWFAANHVPSIIINLFTFFLIITLALLSHRYLYYWRYRKKANLFLGKYVNQSVSVIQYSNLADKGTIHEWTMPKLAIVKKLQAGPSEIDPEKLARATIEGVEGARTQLREMCEVGIITKVDKKRYSLCDIRFAFYSAGIKEKGKPIAFNPKRNIVIYSFSKSGKKKGKYRVQSMPNQGTKLLKGSPRSNLDDLNIFLVSLFQIACDSAPDI